MVKTTKKTKKNVKSKTKKTTLTSKVLSTSGKSQDSIVHTDLHSSLSDSIFKDSFDKFLGDRGDRRKNLNLKENVRASFNRDSSFECSTISEDHDLSTHLPIKSAYTVSSTPNVKSSNGLRIGPSIGYAPQNCSSELFSSSFIFDVSQDDGTKKHRNNKTSLLSISQTPLKSKNRSKVFVSLSRGTTKRKKKSLLKTAVEITLPNKIDEHSDSPGEFCDVITFPKDDKLPQSDVTSLLPNDTNSQNGFDNAVDEACSSFKEESQFFRCLRIKQLKRISQLNLLDSSTPNSSVVSSGSKYAKNYTPFTPQSVNYVSKSQNDLSSSSSILSKPESIRYNNTEQLLHGISNDYTSSSESCIDVSSDKSLASQMTLGNDENYPISSIIKCEAKSSFSAIENSLDTSSRISSRVQSSCENVPGTPTLSNTRSHPDQLPRLPQYVIEMLKGNVSGNDGDISTNFTSISHDDNFSRNLSQEVTMNDLTSSNAESSMEESNIQPVSISLSNNHEHTNLSNGYKEKSSTFSSSLTNVSQMSLNEFSKSHESLSSSANIRSVTKGSVTSIENSLDCSFDTDMSSRAQSSCENVSGTQTLSNTGNSNYFPPLPRHITELLKQTVSGNESASFDCSTDISNNNSSSVSHGDNLTSSIDGNSLQAQSLDGSTLSNTNKIDDSNYSNVERTLSNSRSSSENSTSSQFSEKYSQSDDSQEVSNLRGEDMSEKSSLLSMTNLSKNSSRRCRNQVNVNDDKSDNISKRTRSVLKRLSNESKPSEKPLTQFISSRKKSKVVARDRGTDVTNSTVITNSTSTFNSDKISETEVILTKTDDTTEKENIDETVFAPSNLRETVVESTDGSNEKFQSLAHENTFESTAVAIDQRPRDHLTDISNKVNCINETKLKRSKVVLHNLKEAGVDIRNGSQRNPNEKFQSSLRLGSLPAIVEHDVLSSNKTLPSTLAHENLFQSKITNQNPREHFSDISNKINCINVTKRKRNKVVKTVNLPVIMESSTVGLAENGNIEQNLTQFSDRKMDTDTHSLSLHSGKWRRSLSLYRRHSISMRSAFLLEQTDVESINNLKVSLSNESNRQTLRHSVSFNLSRDNFADFNETSERRAARRRRTSVVNPTVDVGRLTEFDFVTTYKARDTILRKCGQSEPLEFADIYSAGALHQCRKIGEGVYGEVFMNKTDAGRAVVLKIIPIEGSLEVNGEPQKKFDEILSEIVIALQLSSLRNDKEYMTSSFAEVVQVRCVQGRYPNHLIDLWELYRDNYQTENDHPEIFTDDQLYIVFELANGGQDLEAFQFTNALQSKSAFQQMALALAIAEKKLQFEHRDLHWGNILLSPTDEKFVNFKLNGNTLQIPSEGIKVTIIDYTLSRMLYEGIVLYNDLSNDEELFTAHGDYQFDIYRLMKSNLDNDWQRFEPFNNILWLHYIIDKLINGARYKNTKSRKHRLAIEDLMVIRDEITNYKSAVDSVTNI